MVPPIVCEEEEEEDMVTNMRVGYKERQCKCLSKSITIVPPPTKKPCMEILGLEPVSAIPSTLEPSAAAAVGNPALDQSSFATRKVVHIELGGPPLV